MISRREALKWSGGALGMLLGGAMPGAAARALRRPVDTSVYLRRNPVTGGVTPVYRYPGRPPRSEYTDLVDHIAEMDAQGVLAPNPLFDDMPMVELLSEYSPLVEDCLLVSNGTLDRSVPRPVWRKVPPWKQRWWRLRAWRPWR